MLPIESADRFLDVDKLRLELDDEQRASLRVPGEDVDPATLAVDRERHFRMDLPAGQQREQARDGVVHRRMASVEQSVGFASSPAPENIDPDVQGSADATDGTHAQRFEVSPLDERDQGPRYARALAERLLRPTATPADSPDERAHAKV